MSSVCAPIVTYSAKSDSNSDNATSQSVCKTNVEDFNDLVSSHDNVTEALGNILAYVNGVYWQSLFPRLISLIKKASSRVDDMVTDPQFNCLSKQQAPFVLNSEVRLFFATKALLSNICVGNPVLSELAAFRVETTKLLKKLISKESKVVQELDGVFKNSTGNILLYDVQRINADIVRINKNIDDFKDAYEVNDDDLSSIHTFSVGSDNYDTGTSTNCFETSFTVSATGPDVMLAALASASATATTPSASITTNRATTTKETSEAKSTSKSKAKKTSAKKGDKNQKNEKADGSKKNKPKKD